MDVRQLSALVAIADHGTFSGAARALYTVQSNVSGHVAKLEKELGVRLIDRSQGGLTEEGARVVERARRILHEIDDIAADMASLDADVSGEARIGVIGTTARWLMPELLAAVAPRPPTGPHHRPRGQHHHADPERRQRAAARGHRAPPDRRPGAGDRPAVRRGSARDRPRRPPVRQPLVDGARRSRRHPDAAAPQGHGAAPRARPCRIVGRDHAARPGRDRRCPAPRVAGDRRLRRGDRAGHRGPPTVRGRVQADRRS